MFKVLSSRIVTTRLPMFQEQVVEYSAFIDKTNKCTWSGGVGGLNSSNAPLHTIYFDQLFTKHGKTSFIMLLLLYTMYHNIMKDYHTVLKVFLVNMLPCTLKFFFGLLWW